MFYSVVFVGFTLVLGCQCQTPSQSYPFTRQLDTQGNVLLNWEFNATYITLELHTKTTGWIGVGISPGGGMAGADIIVGWVKSGQVTITDRYGTGNQFPPIDNEQNIYDLSGGESNGWTWIKFTRQRAACDSLQDLPITENTIRIIYAFGTTDPAGDDIVPGDYHGTNRGTRNTLFTETADLSSVALPAGEIIETFNLTTGGITIPTKDTYYSCHLFQLPDVPSKRHIVEILPLFQKGNERYIHHIIVYQCDDPLPAGVVVGSSGECFTDREPISDNDCSISFAGWAAGGEGFRYPSDVGLPFGEPGDPRYIRLQVHYDNPNLDAGVVDNSGLTFKYTSQLRTHDAGLLLAGHTTFPYVLIVPPKAESFLTYGDCPADCLQKTMDYANITSFNIFGTLLHTHLLGNKVTLRHFRNGVELPFVTKDDAYDFNFQAFRYVKPERVVLPGDHLQVLCDYDSTGRTNITYGGLPTTREMCYGFLSYYPRLPISRCLTGPILDPYIYNALGITNTSDIRTPAQLTFRGSYAEIYFESKNLTLEQYFNNIPWNQELATQFSNNLNKAPKFQVCTDNRFTPPELAQFVLPVNITQPYVEPRPTCIETPTTTIAMTTTSGQNQLRIMSQSYQLFLIVVFYFVIGF